LPGITPALIKTIAPSEAIICRIEYPPPLTAAEKAELQAKFPGFAGSFKDSQFHDELEYIVDSELLKDFQIVERGWGSQC
jgi:hypothetical protein